MIDEEVRNLIEIAEETARKVLTDKGDDLEILAQGLLEYETLSGNEVNLLLIGEAILRDDDNDKKESGPIKSSVPASGNSNQSSGDKNANKDFNPKPQPEV